MKMIENSIVVHCTPGRLWDTLTKPEETKKYMFGCETVSDWQIGSSLIWRGVYDGKQMDFVTGTITLLKPPFQLAYTTFDPNSTLEDIPENYLTVTYTLQEIPEGVLLTVTQGDYDAVAEGEKRYNEAWNNGTGWSPILEEIKKVAEKG
jgi:uncharacterized protein YndB with AHSA1/START domain